MLRLEKCVIFLGLGDVLAQDDLTVHTQII